MTRVLHVINSMNAGGAEHLLLGQLLAGAHLWEPAIACIDEPGQLAPAVEASGISLFDASGISRSDPRMVTRLRHAVREWRPDVVHLHLPRSGIVGRLAVPRRSGIPVVYTEHNLCDIYPLPVRALNTATYWRNDATIAVSDRVRASIDADVPRAFLRRPPITIRNGIDVARIDTEALARDDARRRFALPGNAFTVGTIGNLFARKGQAFLVEALGSELLRERNIRLIIIGAGDENAALIATAVRLGIADRVTIATDIADARRYARAFDVFVLPSVFEGLPIALLEAMSLALPCVATHVGGVPELIQNGSSGLLVEPRNAAALASAVASVMDDAVLASRIGSEGRARVATEFSLERFIAETDACYRSVLASR